MTTSLKMTKKARFAARQLAVRYNAFNDAIEDGLKDRIRFWGDGLIESQERVGVELYKPDEIRAIIHTA
jgi:hypothetical protein